MAGAGAREWPEEGVHPSLRRSRYWAVGAFLLLVTSLWLPWWVVTYEDDAGFRYDREDAHLFVPEEPATTVWAPAVTGALVAAVGAWLFVRIAGRSHAYEPAAWTRDLPVQAVGLVLALATCLLWPAEVPWFWGGRTFRVDGQGATFTETALPGLGWWLALLAAAALGAAWWTARHADRSSDAPEA